MRTAMILLAGLCLLAGPAARADEALLTKGGCMACHTKDKKLVGPAFKDIAAKYKNSDKGQDVVATLVAKVRAGGKGVFGPIPMPPSGPDKISDADLQASVGWILKQ
ncbi:MAG: c-type cytochrome [Burkholderiaceae bacterium]|nr:c-type cytochrome [Burkholderiaceae bacterium]